MPFLNTKGMLAKLLATENLIVEHSFTCNTASFDTEQRLLKLPVLNTNDEHVYNMFVAHEVGHALQTPVRWKDDIPDDVPFDFVNVVEDVRIEKFIQNKFPGLKKDFIVGYDTLDEKDFFAIGDKDMDEFSFIDRINLHFKLGYRALVPFTDEEMVYVDAVDDADTWQKVLLVAKMLSDYINSKQDSTTNTQQEQQSNDGVESPSNDSSSEGNDTPLPDNQINERESVTQKSFDESLEDMSMSTSRRDEFVYVNIGDINLDEIIIPIDTVRCSRFGGESNRVAVMIMKDSFNDYLLSIKQEVNYMVQQFEMKKSADEYARQQEYKTGVLNTNALHNYRISDDIFLRQSIVPDGKNHGMVMFIDWSGSMENIVFNVVKQVITLVQFCRKVNIPFDVYTFTSGYGELDNIKDGELAHGLVKACHVLTSNASKAQIDDDMMMLFSTAQKISSQYLDLPYYSHLMLSGTPLNNLLFMVPDIVQQFINKTGVQKTSCVFLTDGESSAIGYGEKRRDRVIPQYGYYYNIMVRDGSKVYQIDPMKSHEILQYITEKMGDSVSLSNIFLGGVKACARFMKEYNITMDEKKFRKEGSFTAKSDYWPLIGAVSPTIFGESDKEIDVDGGAAKVKIRNALKKYLQSKKSNKVLLSQLVEQFS